MPQKIDAFTLLVPAADQFRVLAPHLAARYMELSGGSTDDAAAFSDAVRAAFGRVAADQEAGAHVQLVFGPDGGGLHVEVTCAGRRESVGVTIPVAKR